MEILRSHVQSFLKQNFVFVFPILNKPLIFAMKKGEKLNTIFNVNSMFTTQLMDSMIPLLWQLGRYETSAV